MDNETLLLTVAKKTIKRQEKIIRQLALCAVSCPGEYEDKYLNSNCGDTETCISCKIKYAESQVKDNK
jgi:hypothetical protein